MPFKMVALGTTLACSPPPVVTVTELPARSNRAEGAPLEDSASVPEAAFHGPARGVTTLRESLSDEDIATLVRAFVRALEVADVPAVASLVAGGRLATEPDGHGIGTAALGRMGRFQTQRRLGIDLVAFTTIAPASDVDASSEGGELAWGRRVVVSIDTSSSGSSPPLRETFTLVVHRHRSALRIADEITER